ncbi:kinesin-domain-containing protein, partial [Dendrothele bispora CBS 962.96]
MSVPSTPASKIGRPVSFTPKRPLSTSSSSSSLTSSTTSRSTTPLLASTHKKYKASLSVETRRTPVKPRTTLAPVPGTPTKPTSPRPGSRPGTPGSPRKGAESPGLYLSNAKSEMDVSNVDPEEVLVDSQTVETGDGDVSIEMDEETLWAMQASSVDHGKQDKVMVSIRVKPPEGNAQNAWVVNERKKEISLDQTFAKNHPNCNLSNPSASSNSSTPHSSSHSHPSGPNPGVYSFSAILTGSANKPIYNTVAKSHVFAAMEGYNAVIFAYGQTASGKTYTLSGDEEGGEPGIVPRAMRDVFAFIKRGGKEAGGGGREYLLRCSYLEIYNETIYDLLAPPGSSSVVQIQGGGGAGSEVILTPLREEVITSLKSVKEVLKRGMNHRRTACTDWNERSSRSHSVFRLVIESREREGSSGGGNNGRATPSGRATPGGRATPAPGGPRLQARDGRSVQMSVLSLIDLAGSEKATSDKDRTREGKYINTSLLTLGTVIGTLADNATRNKTDHIPYRNSKLTRLLAPSLSGNARISVICTINPDPSAISESTSTLLFAKRVAGVKLAAKKKILEGEVEMEALIERYRKEISDLRKRLEEKESLVWEGGEGGGDGRGGSGSGRRRRMSKQEKQDESQAMRDLQNRIQQLTKLILTSQTIDEGTLAGIGGEGDENGMEADERARPVSPSKSRIDFDMTPYQLQQELLSARLQLETQSTQILSLEAALEAKSSAASSGSSPSLADSQGEGEKDEKDRVIAEQAKTIRELENVVRGYEGFAEPPKKLREDVEREMEEIWKARVDEERRKREEKEQWADEVVKQLEKEKKLRTILEDERRALTAFVTKFDSLGLG